MPPHRDSKEEIELCVKNPEDDISIDPENVERVIQYLRQVMEDSEGIMAVDPNYPSEIFLKAAKALEPGIPTREVVEIAEATRADLKLGEENSPYAEVRACVDALDDTTIPAVTFRMGVIGLALGSLAAAFNQFFLARKPGMVLSVTVVQVIAYPIGRFMAKVLPTRVFHFGRQSFTFNPGPFNIKEHVLISIMANASHSPYATCIIASLRAKPFYDDARFSNKVGFELALLLSTQLMGYALAGLTRSFLIYHREMVWWEVLPQITILRALHGKDNLPPIPGWKITQMRFFLICAVVSGLYFILPGVFFESLSFFNWTTWIDPHNVKLALITGTVTGLGLNPLPTLDWNFMMRGPIFTPLWSIGNEYIGALGALVAICVIYFNNFLFTAYLPINSSGLYDRNGNRFNSSKVLDNRGRFETTEYKSYSPPFMSAALIVFYTCNFALNSSVIVHSMLYYRNFIVGGLSHYIASWKHTFKDPTEWGPTEEPKYVNDVHYRIMKAYPEVPNSWFVVVGVFSIISAIFFNEIYQTQLAIWGLGLSLTIPLLLIIPAGIMQAVAYIQVPYNLLGELVGGYAFDGRPLCNMIFKVYSYITINQALILSADMKLAYYMKVPHRAVFVCQTISTVVGAVISMGVLDWQITEIPDLCSLNQPQHLVCRTYAQFFSSSVIYGAVGPSRLFSQTGSLYKGCLCGFLMGAILPFIPWLAAKKWPHSGWRYVHTPVILAGSFCFPALNLTYITPQFTLSLFFQGYLKRWYTLWYAKYALVLASAMPTGVTIFGLIYFFAFKMGGQKYDWAGNTIYQDGCDAKGCTLMAAPDGGFGPKHWE
ncbi:putative oligopeptide transporter [Melampsora americana]|nr:putative oligopeptide transporter [Melampsora americana]